MPQYVTFDLFSLQLAEMLLFNIENKYYSIENFKFIDIPKA